jgi:transglutaminase-like putative cysteine protease
MVEPLPPKARTACLLAAAACALPLLIQVPPWLALVLTSCGLLAGLSRRAWPAWLRVPLTLMIAGLVMASYGFGIGRDSASAGLLAMLMLKPFETHSLRDARSLLGFSLFAPFAAFLQDQGPLTLGLALPAVLFSVVAWSSLLAGEESAPRWGNLRAAAMTMLIAMPVALAGFWLFPRLATPMWGMPQKTLATMGLGDRMTPNEWLDILVDDRPALRARFLGKTPPRTQMYWRGPVLVRFDGEAWNREDLADQLPTPVIEANAAAIDYEVMLEPTERHDLLVLDLPLVAPPESHLNGTLTAVSDEPINNLVRYQGRSAPKARFTEALPDWQRSAYLQLPPDRDPRTRELAQRWRRQTPDPLALTDRFLQMLRRDFKYTISAPPVGRDATDDFLFNTRLGFCQHFSSAFAVFMRAAGVPTRVVTGFVGGHYNKIGDYWLLYRKDAHAWTEIWVDGRGWVRVDPTAAIAPENILDTVDDLPRLQPGLAGLTGQMLQPVLDTTDFLRRQWNELVLGFNAARQKGLLRPLGIEEAEAWQLVTAFAVGVGLALLLTLAWLLRDWHRPTDPLERAWRAYVRRLGRAGLAKAPEEPALAWAQRLALGQPAAAPALESLSRRYSDARYARGVFSADERSRLIHDLRRFRLPVRAFPSTSPGESS